MTSKVNRENYITVQGWMVTDLKLKGNELLIYACIFGFSQTDSQSFNGSRKYLADWTNSTTKGVDKCLKSLVEKGYLDKRENFINGVKFCDYRATQLPSPENKVPYPGEQSSSPPGEQSSHNNIDSNNLNKSIEDIISYLNEKLGSKYSPKTQKTRDAITARFNEIEGLTVEDFKTVIDKKYTEWHGDEKMEKYLRPETLFGNKFEGYLNQKTGGKRTEMVPKWMKKQEDYNPAPERIKKSGDWLDGFLEEQKQAELQARAEQLKQRIGG